MLRKLFGKVWLSVNSGHTQSPVYLRAVYLRASQHHFEKPSWSERRHYCRDEYDDGVGSRFVEIVVPRICLAGAVIVIGLAAWFA